MEVGDGVEGVAAMLFEEEVPDAEALQRSFQGDDEIPVLVPFVGRQENLEMGEEKEGRSSEVKRTTFDRLFGLLK